ncbi:VOC family protein [Microbacterium sp. No. 7]|uniref:VOC family protein n=1 Tax=Microbacterium sp. No. 7 TaxID=1714373 RepID=UPI0006D2065D|nr:VOC family protein [Microbacterium sp. No. 7]ALJ19601.1 glyoxalase [Microbacterium sp. No. 7]
MSATGPGWAPAAVPTPGAAPDGTRMDTVELLVRDLDTMTAFYQRAVTLDVLDQSGPTATLGRGGLPAMVLRQEKDLPRPSGRGAGLYHTAIVFEDRRRLAAALASMAQQAGHLYEGSADHLVSEAFYFRDPEGNGLELYRDRPREQWTVLADGTVRMGTEFLDPRRFLQRWHDPEAPGDGAASAAIGHVHLQVGDIPAARRFYEGVLGFDVTMAMDSALFLSAGGYHHHLGMNTWHSAGAGPRAAALGLGDVRILVPTRDDVAAFAERLRDHGIAAADDGRALRFSDPWETRLAIAPEND